MRWDGVFLAAVVLAACGLERREYFDEGALCVLPEGDADTSFWETGEGPGDRSFEAAAGLVVTVLASPDCQDSGCDTWSASCDVLRESGTLTVTSEAVVETEKGCEPGDECSLLEASCEAAPVEAGTFTVAWGAATVLLNVPSEDTVCIGL